MDLSATQFDLFCQPTGAFLDPKGSLGRSSCATASHILAPKDTNLSEEAWENSALNPAKRIETLDSIPCTRWRIDGANSQGTQFYVVPLFIKRLNATRIDLFTPSQNRHPPGLCYALDSSWAFCILDSRIAQLGIAKHLLRALEHWTQEVGEPYIEEAYQNAPFGSRIVVDRICADPRNMKFWFVNDFECEKRMIAWPRLQGMWRLSPSTYPPTIDIKDLRLLRLLHDTVALVSLPEDLGYQPVVFKSTVNDTKYMYHELKLLLSMSEVPGVMPKPLYIVTGRDRYGGGDKVFGFILPFFERGNLANELTRRKAEGTLFFADQLKWARQITETLRAIHRSPAKFYSELKADNLLLDEHDNILFIDFEQMGNWFTFSAPEIYFVEYCKILSTSPLVPDPDRQRFKAILATHLDDNDDASGTIYDNPHQGYYTAWTTLSPSQQEAAEVFSLGKTLWCIFEGCSNTRNSVLKSFSNDTGQEYPEFRRTPPKIHELIEMCTKGNTIGGGIDRTEIVRRGDQVFPRGRSGWHGEDLGTAEETVIAAQQMWKERIADMEAFFDARSRWMNGNATKHDLERLGFTLRPSLEEVLRVLIIEEQKVNSRKAV